MRIPKVIAPWFFFFFTALGCLGAEEKAAPAMAPQTAPLQFVMIEYDGGSWRDMRWELEREVNVSLPNFHRWLNQQNLIKVAEEVKVMRLSDQNLFSYPVLYIAGRFAFQLSPEEEANLSSYLEKGGFVIFEDYGAIEGNEEQGKFSDTVEALFKKFYPQGQIKLIPKSHSLFQTPFMLPRRTGAVKYGPTYDEERDDVVPLAGSNDIHTGARAFINGCFNKDRIVAIYKNAGTSSGSFLQMRDPNGDKNYKLWANIIYCGMTH